MCMGLNGHCFIGVTGRLALCLYGADWALFLLQLVSRVAWHFMCRGLIGCLIYSYNTYMTGVNYSGTGLDWS